MVVVVNVVDVFVVFMNVVVMIVDVVVVVVEVVVIVGVVVMVGGQMGDVVVLMVVAFSVVGELGRRGRVTNAVMEGIVVSTMVCVA